MHINNLTCDYMPSPIGFDFERPLLGWVAEGSERGRRQAAYRLQVAPDADFSQLLLDTGRVDSDQSCNLPLNMALRPRTRYFWRVMIWDDAAEASPFSAPAWFETGRYAEPWTASWIGWTGEGLPQLRKGFLVEKPVRRARAYACGVGHYNLFLNGQRTGAEELAPGINAYDSWLQYQTYDVTALLRAGENAMGAWLGDGFYKGRVNWPNMAERRNIFGDRNALICELVIDYADGTSESVVTDASWKASRSPLLRAEIYDGEVFDARLVQHGWDEPGFDDGAWQQAVPVDIDKSKLTARLSVPVTVNERFAPAAVLHTPAGETVLDFCQNMAGWVRLRANAPAGTEIKLQFGEAMDKDGNFYRDNMRTALAEQVYISDGQAREYAPRFTYFGFRYAKVTGWPGEMDRAAFTAEAVYSGLASTGAFECSDPRVNRLFQNALWGQKGNFVDVPTDCPQRDERLGWTGDAQVFCATACLNMQSDAFYRKYLRDLAIEQRKDGYVPVVVPNFLRNSGEWQMTTTGWGDAATIVPWTLYLMYGDEAVLATQYDSMVAWVEYMRKCDTLGVDRYYGHHLGDWLSQDTPDHDNPMGLTPTELIATAYYALSTEIVAKTARILGKDEDAEAYAALVDRIRASFRDEFVTPNGRVAAETQTADLVALGMNMLAEKDRPTVARHLAARLMEDNLSLTTGFIGTPLLCPVLSENGLNEYAYHLLLNNKCPSWLYEVEHGATTVWERWNSVREDGSFGPVSMNSLNHYALGAIAEWMYRCMCGINPVESAPGFKKSLIKPLPNSLLQHARASVDTAYGPLSCGWALDGGKITVEVCVPFNTEAEIHLPDAEGCQVLENGAKADGAVFTRGAGTWRYEYAHNGQTIDKRTPPLPRW